MRKKSAEEKNEPKISNTSFYAIIGIFILLVIFFIVLTFIDYQCHIFPWDCNTDTFNAMGIICQVVSSIVVCVISILGISFSLHDFEKLGIKIRDFYEMREDKHFSFLHAFLISLAFLVCNLVFLFCKVYVLCIGCAVFSFVLCIYVMCKEVPFMMANEKHLISVLKQRFIIGDPKEDYLQQSFNAALDYLICNRNLETAYNTLKDLKYCNSMYNRRVLNKLFDRQNSILNNLKFVSDPLQRKTISDGLVLTASDVLCGYFNLFEIVGSNAENYATNVAWIYISLANLNELSSEIASIFARHVCYDSLNGATDEQKEFYYHIILSVIAYTVQHRNYHILEAIRSEYSQNYILLHEASSSTMLFAVVSMFLFYMAEIEPDVSEDWKEEIRSFISFSGVVGDVAIISWKNMYASFAEFFPISCDDFMHIFNSNRMTLEYMLRRGGMHECKFYTDFAITWYLTNLFNSYRLFNFIYKDELKILTEQKYRFYTEEFWKQCYSDGLFVPTTTMKKIIGFYGVERIGFQGFIAFEERTHNFQNFIKSLKKEDEKIRSAQIQTASKENYLPKVKERIEELITKEYGFDRKMDLQKVPAMDFSVLIQQTENSNELSTMLIRHLSHDLLYKIREMSEVYIVKIPIENNVANIAAIQELLNKDIAAVTEEATYYECFVKDGDLKARYHALYTDTNKERRIIKSNIFNAAIICRNGFRFKISIDKFEKSTLSEEQFEKIVDQYQRADGQYVYQGIFMEREEVADCIKGRYYILSIRLRAIVESENNGIYEFKIMQS